MLVKIEPYKGLPHKNMHLVHYPAMMLFTTAITFPKDESDPGTLTVTYNPPDDEKGTKSLDIPLRPDHSSLSTLQVTMHQSSTQGYNMGDKYNSWFSSCFGFDVKFLYLGAGWRPVLMSTTIQQQPVQSGWFSSITNSLPTSLLGYGSKPEQEKITFADCAPYLVTTEESLAEVCSRFENHSVEIVKFRPNIVLSGAEKAWEEDYWNEITIDVADLAEPVHVVLAQNCARCASLNIDYNTGKPGTGDTGNVLKVMQKDRRVDMGMKYSPVFGRYGFASKGSGAVLRVGDEVKVAGRNDKHTIFGKSSSEYLTQWAIMLTSVDWPGLSTWGPVEK